VPIIAARGA